MTELSNYREYQTENAPPWLQDPNAQAFIFVFGLIKDAFVEAAKQALKLRFPTTAPDDALPHIGENYKLERAFILTDDQYRDLLKQAWDIWGRAGTQRSITDALALLGLTNVEVMHNWEWNAEGRPNDYWKTWYVIRSPYLVEEGDDTASPEETTPGAEQWRGLLYAIKKWKPSEEFAHVIIMLSGKLWGDPAAPWHWGDGTVWGGEAIRTEFT